MNRLLGNILAVLLAVVVTLLVLEFVARIMIAEWPDSVETTKLHVTRDDPDLGYMLPRSEQWRATKTLHNGTLVYSVTYHTDPVGWRDVDQDRPPRTRSIALFGDSVTFGEGLEDNDTLQAQLGRAMPDVTVLERAVPGWGPQNTLALIEADRADVVPGTVGLYIMIPVHVNRVMGDTQVPWLYDSPYYANRSGRLVRDGTYRSAMPVRTTVWEWFIELRQRSTLLRYLKVELPLTYTRTDVEATADMLAVAASTYEQQHNAPFIVVLHPEWQFKGTPWLHETFRNALKRRSVTVIDYMDCPYPASVMIPYDGHPKPPVNVRLAAMLVRDIPYAINGTTRSDACLAEILDGFKPRS